MVKPDAAMGNGLPHRSNSPNSHVVAEPATPMTCKEPGCERPTVARNWCRKHYNQQWKKGLDPLPPKPGRPPHGCTDHPAGTRRCYSLCRCRCAACTRANSTYERQRQKQAAYGRPVTVDAT